MNLKNVEITPQTELQKRRVRGVVLGREKEKVGVKTEKKQERHRDEDAV